MRIQALYDLQQDINRLFIAGSKFAKNDPRLLKQLPFLNKMGEKAPVFKKLASEVEELTKVDAQQSPEKLMAISTLLYSILYTQGDMLETEVEKQEQKPIFSPEKIITNYSYMQLKPLIQALSESNSGRLEVVEDAHKEGVTKDFRTYKYLDRALGDKYSELAAYVEEIIPSTGEAMIPFLVKNFSYDGRPEDVRRLKLLHTFKYEKLDEIVDKIMKGSVLALQAVAIKILADKPENENFIIELTGDKNKLVREAAYLALAKLGTTTSLQKLKELYLTNKNKSNVEGLVNAIKEVNFEKDYPELLERLWQRFDEIAETNPNGDIKKLQTELEKFSVEIQIVYNKDYKETYEFFKHVLLSEKYNELINAKKNQLANTARNIIYHISEALKGFNKNKVLKLQEEIMPKLGSYSWMQDMVNNYFFIAVKKYPKEWIYDIFVDKYKNKLLDIYHLFDAYKNPKISYYALMSDMTGQMKKEVEIDKRWLDVIFKEVEDLKKLDYQNTYLFSFLNMAEPLDSKRMHKLLALILEKELSGNIQTYNDSFFKILMHREVPDRFNLIFNRMSKMNEKNTPSYYFSVYTEADYWKYFPKEYVQKFRDLHKKSKLEMFEDIANIIEVANSK